MIEYIMRQVIRTRQPIFSMFLSMVYGILNSLNMVVQFFPPSPGAFCLPRILESS
ncbi:hypothetical protein VIN14_04515 [Lacticaseibacillus casei]|uniref:hypothetical protein n=1 Tax=Lacticaseibacillus casei TaxID=1582 RepID=UPI0012DFEB21|nr:hypothetical protein [Lacticaseibacillus casei]MBI6596721.1 hypothetical protein [Lacticaseibacillus casei]NIG83849.1 hypothetical protein [Lacticaseibacillus casei]QPC16273.1 hypothetical protein LacC0470_00670 [Lacticaseibacillus casei]